MRWLKHLTRARLDEQVTALVTDCGLESYGFYWMLLEVVGESMDRSERCSISYPVAQWARLLSCHRSKVYRYMNELQNRGLIQVKFPVTVNLPQGILQDTKRSSSDNIEVSIPKLLKYRDEYSKKSGHSPDTLRTEDRDRDREETPTGGEGEDSLFGKSPTTSGSNKLDELIEPFATQIFTRHPRVRRCALSEVRDSLRSILKKVPAGQRIETLQRIDRNHESWCSSEQWQKDGGEYSKGLDNWLRPTKGRFNAACPSTEAAQQPLRLEM
jgi:hypothetical protein